MLLARTKLNTIKVLISKALIDSYINHNDSFYVLSEYNEMNEEVKNPENAVEYTIKTMETYCVSCKKNTAYESSSVRRSKQNRLMLI